LPGGRSGTDDAVKATPYTDPVKNGVVVEYKKAFVKINDKEYEVDVDNKKPMADIEIEVEKGEADLTAWLELEDGTLSNSFYIYVKKQ
jgi:hypothetical protein